MAFGQFVVAPASTTLDFARCLTGQLAPSCFTSSARLHTAAIGNDAPGGLSYSVVGSTVTLSWSAPADPVVAYVLEAGSSPGASNLVSASTGSTATTYAAIGVGAGTYFVRVRALSPSFVTSAASNEIIVTVGGSAPCSAPGAPGNLTLTGNSAGTVSFSWTAASGSPTSYTVEAGSSSGLANLANSDLGLTTTLTANGVSPGTYYVRVKAKNACGTSAASNELNFTVASATPTGSAPAVTTSAASAVTTTTATMNGTVNPNGLATSAFFQVGLTAAYGTTSSIVQLSGSSAVGVNSTTNNLSPGTTYHYRLVATNSAGTSDGADVTFTTTPTATPGTSFGAGRWLIGSQVSAGRYYSTPASGCYWERLSGLGGTFSEILANDFVGYAAGQIIVDLLVSDRAFSTDADCRTWFNTPRSGLQAGITPGMWLVGSQVSAGTYSATVRSGCYWERLRHFDGTIAGIIDNDFISTAGTQRVTISASDVGFQADDDCGTWTRVSSITAEDVAAARSPHQILANWQLQRARKKLP